MCSRGPANCGRSLLFIKRHAAKTHATGAVELNGLVVFEEFAAAGLHHFEHRVGGRQSAYAVGVLLPGNMLEEALGVSLTGGRLAVACRPTA